jgi:hypothetical protein
MASRIQTYTQEEQQQKPSGQVRTQRGDGSVSPAMLHELEGGSFAETIAGAGAVTLAILAIIGVLPVVLGAIATMAVGVGLFMSGGSIATRSSQLEGGPRGVHARRQIMAGLGMEALAGLSGAVLGLLALLGISSLTLMGVAAIVLGGALLMASAATARLESDLYRSAPGEPHQTSHEAVNLATGSDFLVGVGAIVLGILSLTGWAPLTLALVAMLGVGAAGMLNGSALATRFFAMFGY